jgi:hypothetical protein
MISIQLSKESLTTAGKWGFFLILLMVLSFRADFRLQLGGLLVHPYLVILPLALFFSNFQLSNIPTRATIPLLSFFIVFSLACLQNLNPLSEIFKVGAALATFLFFASAVKSEKDFEWMSWGLLLCATTIGVQGFLIGEDTDAVGSRLSGINVLEGIGNKNAQSLFTLPGLFFGSNLLIRLIGERRFLPTIPLIIALFFIIISLFLSANRSGWLGMAIIFLSVLFITGLRGRTLFFSVVMVIFSYVAVERYANDIVTHKRKQTEEGYSSDTGRRLLMIHSLRVGLENPLTGVGMDELHYQMALRLGLIRFGVEKKDTHFLPGYLFGATGIFSLSLFLFFLISLFPKIHHPMQLKTKMRHARSMVIFFVVLFVLRSFFSREILYSPTFMGGLGLVYGYYILQIRRVANGIYA